MRERKREGGENEKRRKRESEKDRGLVHELRYEGKETRAAVLREQTAVFVLSSTERASQLLSKHTNIRRLREESQRGTGLEGSLSFGVKEMAKVPGADDERSLGRGARGRGRRGERARTARGG